MVATREGLLQYRVAGPVGMCEPQAARARRGQQGHALAGAQRAAPPVQRLQRHLAEQLLVARPGNGHGVAVARDLHARGLVQQVGMGDEQAADDAVPPEAEGDRKSTRLNSSHSQISYAVFCLKKKKYKKMD